MTPDFKVHSNRASPSTVAKVLGQEFPSVMAVTPLAPRENFHPEDDVRFKQFMALQVEERYL